MSTTVRMNLLVIYTANLLDMKQFYEAIGLKFQEEKHGSGFRHYACTLNDQLVLEIYPGHEITGGRMGFEVDNLPAVLEALGPWHTQKMTKFSDHVVVRDPDNRPIHLSERKK